MKKLLLAVISAIALSCVFVFLFFNCQKKDESNIISLKNKNSLSSFYDSHLISEFQKEAIVQEFEKVIRSFNIKISNGILIFDSAKELLAVYDTLIYYSNVFDNLICKHPKYEESDKFPSNPALFILGTS